MNDEQPASATCVDCGNTFIQNHPEDEICLPCWNGTTHEAIRVITEWLTTKEERDAQR